MLSTAPLLAERTNGGDVSLELLLLRAVRLGRQLDERVQRHRHPRAALLRDVHKVRVDAAQDRLVRHDQYVLRPLQLHDDGLQPDHHVAVRLAAQVAVVVLVLVALLEVFRVLLLDFAVGEAVADARVELVERFPFQLLEGEEARGLDRAL